MRNEFHKTGYAILLLASKRFRFRQQKEINKTIHNRSLVVRNDATPLSNTGERLMLGLAQNLHLAQPYRTNTQCYSSECCVLKREEQLSLVITHLDQEEKRR